MADPFAVGGDRLPCCVVFFCVRILCMQRASLNVVLTDCLSRTMAGPWHKPLRSAGKGTRVASILAGHRLFVRGSPTRFDDSLSAHFLFVESTLKPISLGLRFAPYFFRSLHAESLRDENELRKAALEFWSHERWYASITNGVAVRLLLLVYRGAWTLLWVPVAFFCPSFTHRVLQHGNDIMLQKYLAIGDGAPRALQRDIADRLPTFISFHDHAAELTNEPDPNVAIALLIVWIIYFNFCLLTRFY